MKIGPFLCSAMGNDGHLWDVHLEVGGVEPLVTITRPYSPRYQYTLATLLATLLPGNTPRVLWLDSGLGIGIDHSGLLPAFQKAQGRISRLLGCFEVRWLPNDPDAPF